MERNEALEMLIKLQQNGDPEEAHIAADNILCRLLESLGYEDVVVEYLNIEKWFA